MQRLVGFGLAALALLSNHLRAPAPEATAPALADPSDIGVLITEARGAPRNLCAYAARSAGNGWGGWADAPVTPLPDLPRRRGRRPRGDAGGNQAAAGESGRRGPLRPGDGRAVAGARRQRRGDGGSLGTARER